MIPRWFAIVDIDVCDQRSAAPEDAVEAAIGGGAPRVIVRGRRQPAGRIVGVIDRALRRVPPTRLVVSDRADVCVAFGLAGVHLPASGLPVSLARAVCGPTTHVGTSAHDAAELERARRAAWVFVSPVWPTASKPGHPGIGLEGLADLAARSSAPAFALGGVTPERVGAVIEHGAHGCAALSPFCAPPADVARAAAAFVRAFERI